MLYRYHIWSDIPLIQDTWSEESLMQVYDDDDLHGGQRSSEVKCGKLCSMATKASSYDSDDLHRGQRSTEVKCVNLCYIATTFGQIYR